MILCFYAFPDETNRTLRKLRMGSLRGQQRLVRRLPKVTAHCHSMSSDSKLIMLSTMLTTLGNSPCCVSLQVCRTPKCVSLYLHVALVDASRCKVDTTSAPLVISELVGE